MFKNKILPILSLSLLAMLIIGACAAVPGKDLKDITWQWTSLNGPTEQISVPNPDRYTLLLNADGTASIKADCNSVFGSYTLNGSALTITLGGTTLMYCGDDSMDTEFKEALSTVASYRFEGKTLLLQLADDAGTMEFKQ